MTHIKPEEEKRLRQVFFQSTATLGAHDMSNVGKWWEVVRENHTCSWRSYHDIMHICDMVEDVDMTVGVDEGYYPMKVSASEWDFITLMCFFLYIDYDPHKKPVDYFNSSAELWQEFCDNVKIASRWRQHGWRIISGAYIHYSTERIASIIYEIDWNDISSNGSRYNLWKEGTREEYDFLTDMQWREHRIGQLRSILALPAIYTNFEWSKDFHDIAAKNIQFELDELLGLHRPHDATEKVGV